MPWGEQATLLRGGRNIITTIGAYALLVLFFVLEGRLRQGQAAKSFAAGESDQRSTRYVGAAFGISIVLALLAPLLNWLKIGSVIPAWLAWLGLLLAAGGLALRLWAPRVLGRFYTRTLRTQDQQTVVEDGPYRLIRHPGYAGTLAMWIGVGLALGNAIVALVMAVMLLAAYLYRIQSEEQMLVERLGQPYRDYQARTRRLIPFIY